VIRMADGPQSIMFNGVRRMKSLLRRVAPRRRPKGAHVYEDLYEKHGRELPPTVSVGDGDFDLIGAIELGILTMEGLRPEQTIVDFGCGTGRLAVHLIPFLDGGAYVGIDIAQSMLQKAQALVSGRIPKPRCRVTWQKQTDHRFQIEEASVDTVCAFSVFTHMEHEDAYRYLKAAQAIVRPGGRFIFSCLPMDLAAARDVFVASAGGPLEERWAQIRNVTTSVDLMNAVARLAGWEPVRWYRGDEQNVRVPGRTEMWGLGQSTCVLEKAAPPRHP